MTSQYSQARILVVDGYTLSALATAEYLQQCLHIEKIETARTGAEAWQRIQTQDAYHLIIISDDLDFISGAEVIRKIRADKFINQTRVIGASFEESAEKEFRDAGANYFHLKSTYSSERILELSKRALNYSFCPPAPSAPAQ